MNQTTIKIPGKNNRDTSKAAVLARKALNRPRGRPMKLTSSNQSMQIASTSTVPLQELKRRSMRNIKSKRKMANLERLPIELLEKVYLYCLSVDLPRSSPVIAAKLNSETVYIRTIIGAFGPTWDACYGRLSHSKSFQGVGDAKLQTSLLSCRWMSLSLLLKAQDIWVQRNALNRQVEISTSDLNRNIDEEDCPDIFYGRIPSDYFEDDFSLFSAIMTEETLLAGTYQCPATMWDTYVGVSDNSEIPEILLRGPWTIEMTRYLYWLVRNGARLEWITSTTGEIALQGLRKAIFFGDLRVICLLSWAGLTEKLEVGDLIWALTNAGGDKLAVLQLLVRLKSFSYVEQTKFRAAMEEFQDEARSQSDLASVAFINNIEALDFSDGLTGKEFKSH